MLRSPFPWSGNVHSGFSGLAPYFFKTDLHIFLSNNSVFGVRLRQENDLLIAQRLITEPYLELNLFAQDVPEQNIDAGFSDVRIGLQTRYEITRKFAPYLDLRYEKLLGNTAKFAKRKNIPREEFVASLGLRLMF